LLRASKIRPVSRCDAAKSQLGVSGRFAIVHWRNVLGRCDQSQHENLIPNRRQHFHGRPPCMRIARFLCDIIARPLTWSAKELRCCSAQRRTGSRSSRCSAVLCASAASAQNSQATACCQRKLDILCHFDHATSTTRKVQTPNREREFRREEFRMPRQFPIGLRPRPLSDVSMIRGALSH
jgi:hypothetical protein